MLHQKGFVHILLIIVLLAGLIAALFIIKDPTNLLPKAANEDEIDLLTNQLLAATKDSSFKATPSETIDSVPTVSLSAKLTKQDFKVGEEVAVQILIQSDTDSANLFVAKLKYDPDLLSFQNMDDSGSVIKNWVERDTSTAGSISLVGGYPNPGLQTKPEDTTLMATLKFKTLKNGITTISIDEPSAIYRNSDNVNILKVKNNAQISVGDIPGGKKDTKDLVNIAKKRQELLLQKIQTDPKGFLDKATLVDQRDNFPDSVKPHVEQKINTEGTLKVIHGDDFQNKKSTLEYVLQIDSNTSDQKWYKLYFAKNPPEFSSSGAKLKVDVVAIDGYAALLTGDTSTAQTNLQFLTVPTRFPTTGEQKTLVLMVNSVNNPVTPYTADQIRNMIFNTTNPSSVNNYYKETSFNKTFLSGDVFGWYSITATCDDILISSLAKTKARDAGVNVDNYTRTIYILAGDDLLCGRNHVFLGAASTTESWIYRASYLAVAHEFGHMLGVNHANNISCQLGRITPETCNEGEYGDSHDVMGLEYQQFNAPHKVGMGWIPDSNIERVTASGIFTLAPLELVTTTKQVLQIPKQDTNGESYFISYRQNGGFFDSNLDAFMPHSIQAGVSIHTWRDSSFEKTKFIEHQGTFTGSTILDGEIFQDQINNIQIKQINHNTSGVTVEVTIPTSPPSGLPPRRVFITSTNYNGDLKTAGSNVGLGTISETSQHPGLDGADKICQSRANSSTTYPDLKNSVWKAWLSDSTLSAASRLSHSGSFTLVNGNTIANDWNDLTDGFLAAPINTDENGNILSKNVWTSTKISGDINHVSWTCNNWTNPTNNFFGSNGFSSKKDKLWTEESGGSGCASITYQHLYCFEEPAPTPPPPPSVTYSLNPGWSAIGIPFSGFTAETLMASPQYVNNKCDRLLGADKVWDKNLPSVFITLHDLDINRGYWIRCNEPLSFTLTGISSPNLQIAQGWNLITMPLKAVQPLQSSTFMSDQTLANNNCQTIRELGSSEPYFTTTPNLLTVGQGYYLYCNSAFTITFANNFINNASVLSFNTSPISLLSRPEIPAIPTPTPTPPAANLQSSPASTSDKGDGNNDKKIDLIDLSVLLADFGKSSNFRGGIDMNGDGIINAFDFSQMRNLLIEKGVIKGT